MRRKSERRKSTDATTSVPRRTSRRAKKSPVLKTENLKKQSEIQDGTTVKVTEVEESSKLSRTNEQEKCSQPLEINDASSVSDKSVNDLHRGTNKPTEMLPGNKLDETKVIHNDENDDINDHICTGNIIQIIQSQKAENPANDSESFTDNQPCSKSPCPETLSKEKEFNQNVCILSKEIEVDVSPPQYADEQENEKPPVLDAQIEEVRKTTENFGDQNKIVSTKKRKWLSKNSVDLKGPIMSISTDSLKNLISDVHPVPLSDIKLESSSEVEEISSDKIQQPKIYKASHRINKREREKDTILTEETSNCLSAKNQKESDSNVSKISSHLPLSPPKNEPSTILFITNLVRPFTIMQLKGLLARTGRITPGGFWIDRIKSKCYVRYETEDESIETRHALHGVRWPTSNPKCLNVDFGDKISLEKAISSTRDETPTFGQDNSRDNRIIGTGWDRDRLEFDEEKVHASRPVREWDVGKKEDFGKDNDRGRDRARIREFEREKDIEINVKRRHSLDKVKGFGSLSPNLKKIKKKENDPPLRLLDDLFRKTTATPCIYWLPLTPEQIAEKEAFRLKRIEEHQERIKQRELEREKILIREKERAKGKDRQREHDREKEKERRRDRERSNERRKSRSRERRRY